MDKQEIAAVLGNMATLLELKGENPFKVRAYENAARIIEGLADNIDDLIQNGSLTEIKGIGKNLADHITELSKTGGLKEYEALRKTIPDGVILMLSIPGLGPKRVRFLWEKLKIKTVGELEMACKRNMLAEEPGFGEKLTENILAGIESLKRFAGKRLYAEAYLIAKEIHAEVKKWPEVICSEIAGSIRRKKEIVKDIDILVATNKPNEVMDRFVKIPFVDHVVQHGETKSEVVLRTGIQCDLRAVEEAEYPFALHYFTGSKEHNVAVRALAKKAGLKLNEYGLFRGDSQKSVTPQEFEVVVIPEGVVPDLHHSGRDPVADSIAGFPPKARGNDSLQQLLQIRGGLQKSAVCRDEAGLLKTLGLEYIEPELREDTGEIEAAAEGKLPKLIEYNDVKGVIHCHTTYTDGADTIARMADAARELGYKYIAICDHSQSLTVVGGLKPQTIKLQHKEIDALNKKLKDFRILKGIEVDILPDGALDFDDEILSSFDVVIAAVHSRFAMKEDEMTARITKAISNPHVDILAHPTGRLLLAREAYAVGLKKVIEVAAKNKVALEINSHPQRLDLDWRWCKYAKGEGAKFVICPDAHSAAGIRDIEYGVNVARKGWLEKSDVLNCLKAEEFLRAL